MAACGLKGEQATDGTVDFMQFLWSPFFSSANNPKLFLPQYVSPPLRVPHVYAARSCNQLLHCASKPCHEKAGIIKFERQSCTVSTRNVLQMFSKTQTWSSLSSQLSTFCSFLSFHFNLSSAGLAILAQVTAAEILRQLPEAFRVPFFFISTSDVFVFAITVL